VTFYLFVIFLENHYLCSKNVRIWNILKTFSAGRYVQQAHYKCFIPNPIDRQWIIDDPEINDLLSRADQAIGRLDSFATFVPNLDLFISMHVAMEAVQSTKIEGTQTNIEEVFQDRNDLPQEKRDDWDEVQNYIRAIDLATKETAKLPFSSRLIRTLHQALLQGVRGEHKSPGEFRTSQNWIGGAAINDAKFVPPVQTVVPELMGDLEKFANNEAIHVPDLIRIAIIHYQFETIHPFLDGNGRIGRLLIPIYLENKCVLKRASILYLSDFFERYRQLYYDNLMKVRTDNDLGQWLKFFLVGVIEVSNNSIETFKKVILLKERTDQKLMGLKGKAPDARKVLERLWQNPILNVTGIMQTIGKSQPSAYNLLNDLERLGILRPISINSRKKQYVFGDYMRLFMS
jgi:Fic family protein